MVPDFNAAIFAENEECIQAKSVYRQRVTHGTSASNVNVFCDPV